MLRESGLPYLNSTIHGRPPDGSFSFQLILSFVNCDQWSLINIRTNYTHFVIEEDKIKQIFSYDWNPRVGRGSYRHDVLMTMIRNAPDFTEAPESRRITTVTKKLEITGSRQNIYSVIKNNFLLVYIQIIAYVPVIRSNRFIFCYMSKYLFLWV